MFAAVERLVVSPAEKVPKPLPRPQSHVGRVEFDAPIRPAKEQIAHELLWSMGACLNLGEDAFARGEIDRSAIVWIDEALIPQLAALVCIWHPRNAQLEQGLCEAVGRSRDVDSRAPLRGVLH